ncbi:MAG: DUF2764 family protein [Kiritimatiellia bacterium]
MSYPYFAATLPLQRFGEAPAMGMADFRASCAEHLSASDNAALAALLDGGENRHSYVRAWRAIDTQFRNAVARQRAARLAARQGGDRGGVSSGDASKWLHPHEGWSVALETAVTAAFQEANPLKRERALARIRWDWAEELAGRDPFSAEAIFAYGLRLQLATRLAAVDAGKGDARLCAFAETVSLGKDV